MKIVALAAQPLGQQAVAAFRLDNEQGLSATFSAYGARLMSLTLPNGSGPPTDVVMGPDTPAGFAARDTSAGAICGRFANRIGRAQFAIDGLDYPLAANESVNQLHGGPQGFSQRVWQARAGADGLAFKLTSPDGDQGYPGALNVHAVYRLEERSLSCTISATTDHPTAINLTHHAYWNLSGNGAIHDHFLKIAAGSYTPVGAGKIPTGRLLPVAGTAFDFQGASAIGPRFSSLPDGFDHNFCLSGARGDLRMAAQLYDPKSRRTMTLLTTEPGLQVYTAAHFGPELAAKPGQRLERFGAIALEPQNWPDAPNHPEFPPAILRPGETYRHRMVWDFDWA